MKGERGNVMLKYRDCAIMSFGGERIGGGERKEESCNVGWADVFRMESDLLTAKC
jgi:hypothetical protein